MEAVAEVPARQQPSFSAMIMRVTTNESRSARPTRVKGKMVKYYLIAVQDNVEPDTLGPFSSDAERDQKARCIRSGQNEDDGLFWANVGDTLEMGLEVGSYNSNFFEEQETS